MRNDFAIFILSHGRANNQITLKTLRKAGYTGKWDIVVDDSDEQKDEYVEKYGDHIIVFDKNAEYEKADTFTNEKYLKCILYARNACEKIAKKNEFKYFCQLDDDITSLVYRYEDDEKAKSKNVTNLDDLLEAYIDFLESGNISCASFATQNAFIGGVSSLRSEPNRRCFNVFFRNVNIPVKWRCAMNEDYITSILEGMTGKVFIEPKFVGVGTKEVGKGTQTGGMKETYAYMSDYERCFYAVIAAPSAFSVEQNLKKFQITLRKDFSVPKILNERWRKHAR